MCNVQYAVHSGKSNNRHPHNAHRYSEAYLTSSAEQHSTHVQYAPGKYCRCNSLFILKQLTCMPCYPVLSQSNRHYSKCFNEVCCVRMSHVNFTWSDVTSVALSCGAICHSVCAEYRITDFMKSVLYSTIYCTFCCCWTSFICQSFRSTRFSTSILCSETERNTIC